MAAVFEGDGHLSIEERRVPTATRPDDVLIQVEACGICGTDVHILEVPPGHPATPGVILGHEFVGLVRETGPEVAGLPEGTRVVVAPNLSCGSCRWCRRGLANHCENFTTLGIFRDGGLAEYAVAPARACHPISSALPREVAALAEPVSCVINGVEQARLFPGEMAAIFGAGPIGLIFLSLFRAAGAGRTVVIEPSDVRRDIAKRLGADVCVDPGSVDVATAIAEESDGIGVDVAVDAVGTQVGAAVQSVRRAGRVLLFGMNANSSAPIRQFDITRSELTVLGTYVGTNTFPSAIRILEERVVDLSPLVSDRFPLAELSDAVEATRSGRAVKAIVDLVSSADD